MDGTFSFKGGIDEVKFYNRALSSNEVGQLYLSEAARPPAITQQPQNQTVAAGTNVVFSVTATGTAPLSYQWRKGGVTIPGATNATWSLTNVQAAWLGSYTVVITNSIGSVTSSVATLSIPGVTPVQSAPIVTAQPQGLSTVAQSPATLMVGVEGTAPFAFQWFKDGVSLPAQMGISLQFVSLNTFDSGNYSVVVANQYGSATSAVARLEVEGLDPQVTWSLPVTFRYGQALITNQLNVQAVQPGAIQFSETNGTVLPSGPTPIQLIFTPDNSALYATVVLSNTLDVLPATLTATARNNVRLVGENNPPLTIDISGFVNGDSTNVLTSFPVMATMATPASPAGSYPITVTGGSASNYVFEYFAGVLIVGANEPSFLAQPTNQHPLPGTQTEFRPLVTGKPPLFFHWVHNGHSLVGETNETLIISSVGLSNLGWYELIASNSFGVATSQRATITFPGLPAIIINPEDQFAAVGTRFEYEVVHSGTPPFSFLWTHNLMQLPINGPSLIITNAQPNHAGFYQLSIANGEGFAQTRSFQLTIANSPQVSYSGGALVVIYEKPINIQPVAQGDTPLHFRWYRDGQLLAGQTNLLLSIPSAARNDSGNYLVEVSNQVAVASADLIPVRVIVPQRFDQPAQLGNGAFRLKFGSEDNINVGDAELSNLIIEASRDFTNWRVISSNGGGMTRTNGQLRFDDPDPGSRRYYRIITR
jgi:hypothetical protein